MELRKVNELPELGTLPDSAEVILVDGDTAKRIPVSKTGLKKEDPKPTTPTVAVTVFTVEAK